MAPRKRIKAPGRSGNTNRKSRSLSARCERPPTMWRRCSFANSSSERSVVAKPCCSSVRAMVVASLRELVLSPTNTCAMLASENGLLAIKLGGRGDQTATAIRWRYQKPVPQVPSTLLYKGVLYMVNDGGVLISFDPATGNVIKQGRLQGAIDKYFSSPVGADDKVFLIGEGGAVSVLKAAGDWEILAVNNLDDECFATPAIADSRIYLRTSSALYCFGKKGEN